MWKLGVMEELISGRDGEVREGKNSSTLVGFLTTFSEMTRAVMRTHENQKSLVAHQTHFCVLYGIV